MSGTTVADNASLAIFDGSRLFRDGLATFLERSGYTVTCTADALDGADRGLIDEDGPSVALIGANCPPSVFASELEKAAKWWPEAHRVVLAREPTPDMLAEAIAADVSGFFLKSVSGTTLKEGLNLIMLGQKVFPNGVASLLQDTEANGVDISGLNGKRSCFSRRELDVLRCLGDAESNKAIAKRLDISDGTVRVHVKTILKKTGASNRTQAAIWAIRKGIA